MSEAPGPAAEIAPVTGETGVAPVVPATSSPESSAAPVAPETGAAAPSEPVVAAEGAEAAPADAADPAEGAEQPAEAEAEAEAPAEASEEKPEGEGEKPQTEPQAIKYEAWTLPEDMAIDAPHLSALNDVFAKHGLTQEAAQEIVDRGAFILKDAQERMAQSQRDVFAETQQQWVKDFEKQSGNRRNTILNDAKSAIASAIPDAKARQELWSVLAFTGAGNHPSVIKAFAEIGKGLRERGAPASGVPQQQSTSPADRRYGRSN